MEDSSRLEGRPVSGRIVPVTLRLPMSGLELANASTPDVVAWLSERSQRQRLLLGANLHAVYLAEADPEFRAVYESADLVIIDGFPVGLAARLARLVDGAVHRVGSTDWIEHLGLATRDLRIAVLGATPASSAAALDALVAAHPRHTFAVWDGYEGVKDLESSGFAELHDFAPDLVLVGLGMPRQEAWFVRHRAELPATATVAMVGGAIDHVSGEQALAPRWLGNIGFEWVWRLAHQPRRLAHRYLVEPFALAILLARKGRRSRV